MVGAADPFSGSPLIPCILPARLRGDLMKTLAALLVLTLAMPTIARAQSDVGDVSFPNSGSPAAQPAFLRGLALLHNFEYPYAAESFREAQKLDPDFVMAYWGEALTYTHPVWQQQNAEQGRKTLQKLGATPAERATKAKTDRERAYLQTVEVLYGDGTKEERDFRFADAMASVHAKYPDDVDATAFTALALLGTSHHGRDTATYMRAAALLEEVLPSHLHHPGVLHYMIHCYDDPIHAPLGMRAALRYGAVAPQAGHALHMTSHIFVAMGMWDDVIDVNRQAIAVVNAQRVARGNSKQNCGHYPTWLHYALVQERRFDEAQKMLDACRADVMDPAFKPQGGMDTAEGRGNELADMVANQVAGGGALSSVPDEIPALSPDAKLTMAYARALASASDAPALKTAAARLREMQKGAVHPAEHHDMGGDPYRNERMAVVQQQLDALELFAAGHRDESVALLRKAADAEAAMPFDFGPPPIAKPAVELLADELLAMGRGSDAVAAYREALARTPGRTRSLEGLMRAQKLAGDADGAAKTALLVSKYVKQ
jgi:tetratricopeptide (TPR) repeat protein